MQIIGKSILLEVVIFSRDGKLWFFTVTILSVIVNKTISMK